ncbi:MAG: hypothetical protein JWO67_6537 [Streptosporangiaceae bacterium]|nr:hypothetical protein [Streptosporangiaceae bacterium]
MTPPVVAGSTSATDALSTAGTLPRRLRDLLTEHLYPDSEEARRFGNQPLVGLAVWLIATVVALLRLPPRSFDTIWAEDGHIFLQEALGRSFWDSLQRPYAGYLHIYPRLVAEVAATLPLSWAGWVFSVAGAAVVGLAAWSVWSLGAAVLPSAWLRAGVTAGVVLIPAGGLEAVDNVANSHFFLLLTAFWALVGRRPGWAGQVLPVVIVVLAAGSDPLTALLAPIAVGRLVIARTARDRVVALAYFLVLAVQLGATLSSTRPAAGGLAAPRDLAFGYAYRVVSATVLSTAGAQRMVAVTSSRGVWALGAGIAGVAIIGLLWSRRRLAVAATGIASVTVFLVNSAFARGDANFHWPPAGAFSTIFDPGARYTIVPALFLVSMLGLTAHAVREHLPGPLLRPAEVALFLAPLFVLVATDYRNDQPGAPALRGMAAPWSQEVNAATRACRAAAADEEIRLSVAPNPRWDVRLRCAVLGQSGEPASIRHHPAGLNS